MFAAPYELYQYVQAKGYIPPMAGQITLETITATKPFTDSTVKPSFTGTGEHLKQVMECDRRNVFKCFYVDAKDNCESTWLAGDEPGTGMMLPMWAERLIHADVLVMQEKVDCTMDYLLHVLSKQKQAETK